MSLPCPRNTHQYIPQQQESVTKAYPPPPILRKTGGGCESPPQKKCGGGTTDAVRCRHEPRRVNRSAIRTGKRLACNEKCFKKFSKEIDRFAVF